MHRGWGRRVSSGEGGEEGGSGVGLWESDLGSGVDQQAGRSLTCFPDWCGQPHWSWGRELPWGRR